VAATIDRVAREDWALPAHVIISANMEGLLNQLLESRPRKRGTARGILAFHPFFTDNCTRRVAKCQNLSFNEEVSVHEKENNKHYNIRFHKQVTQPNVEKSCDDQQTTTNEHGDLTPIEGLHRLPPFKYEWKEGRVQFAVFLLGHDGLVIHEEKNGNGRWLSVSSDGKNVVSDYLKPEKGALDVEKSWNPTSNNYADQLYHEAFRRTAPNFKCSIQSRDMNFHTQLQSLNTLLHPSSKRDLRLYKAAERLVQSVKSSTPKVIVYLYSPNTSLHHEKVEESHNRMFAKVMLMENCPRADVEAAFVEGTTFQLSGMGQKMGRMTVRWENESIPKESTFDFDPNKVWNSDLVDLVKAVGSPDIFTMAQKLSHHFRMVQSAFEECLRIEQSQQRKKSNDDMIYPVTIKVAAAGWDRRQWVVVDEISATSVGR